MNYICAKCKKEYSKYGGYAVEENKNLCSECWKEYIEMQSRHYRELKGWWQKGE